MNDPPKRKLPYFGSSETIAGGLFHPNCKHRATTFFPGMQNDHSADGKFENEPKQAEHNKCLREIQRQKRIAAGSLDENTVRVAKNRQKQWENRKKQIESERYIIVKSIISIRNNIEIIGGGYEKCIDKLRELNKITKLYENDYDFAFSLFNVLPTKGNEDGV